MNRLINQNLHWRLIAAGLCLVFLASCSPAPDQAQSKTNETQNTLTSDEARAIAKEAYTYYYPLVLYYRTMYLQAIDPFSDEPGVGFGNWLHLGTSTPQDTDIVAPNNDTPYSYAWVDTRAEPWVLTLPRIEENRFYTSQWNDLWGFVLENTGSVFDGNDGVSILLASPNWDGDLPEGVKRVVRGDTDFLGSLTRTQVLDSKDLPNVERIQGEYKLQPLSAYLGEPAPAAAPAIEWKPWQEGDEITEEFWNYVNFLLPLTTPNVEDKPVQDRAARIGIAAGQPWDPSMFDDDVRGAIAAGMEDAMAEFSDGANNITDPSLFFRTREDLNKDYFNRALGTFVGIFGNWESISVYFSVMSDAQDEFLDGSKHSYTVRFSEDQIPPVKSFWSFTMYKLPQRWLVDNPIDRYSIGSSTPGVQTSDDGSITLYFGATSPGEDQQSNWLPSPEGQFWLVLRTYGPGQEILEKQWKIPPINQHD